MNAFIDTMRAEMLKTKGTAAVWLTLLAAVFIPFVNFMILTQRPDVMAPKFQTDAWLVFMRANWKNVAAIILPMYAILISNLIIQIEYRNNTWKLVYTQPRSFAGIFFSKFLLIQLFIAALLILFNLSMAGSALLAAAVNSRYHFRSGEFPFGAYLTEALRIYLGLLTLTVVQFWLSLRFRNFVVPLGMGIGLWLAGIVLMDWDKSIYYPYMYPVWLFFTDFTKYPQRLTQLTVCSAVTFVIALAIAFWDINRQPERG